jgi:hypothetical protein
MYNPYKPKPSIDNLLKKSDNNEPLNKPSPSLSELRKLCTPSRKWLDKCLKYHPAHVELEEMNSTGIIEFPFWVVTASEKEEYLKRSFNTYKPHAEDYKLEITSLVGCTSLYYNECSKFYQEKAL